ITGLTAATQDDSGPAWRRPYRAGEPPVELTLLLELELVGAGDVDGVQRLARHRPRALHALVGTRAAEHLHPPRPLSLQEILRLPCGGQIVGSVQSPAVEVQPVLGDSVAAGGNREGVLLDAAAELPTVRSAELGALLRRGQHARLTGRDHDAGIRLAGDLLDR